MQYDIKPLNGKVLLKRIIIEKNEEEVKKGFLFEEPLTSEVEYFEIVSLAQECGYNISNGNIVTVENYRPLGEINGEQLFVCDQREVTCRILPKNELKDTK